MDVNTKIEESNKLIEHLENKLAEESDKLFNMAIEAMDIDEDAPFPETSLLKAHKEYKLMEQRVFGIVDTIEEVKAFLEGFFDGPPQVEEEGE